MTHHDLAAGEVPHDAVTVHDAVFRHAAARPEAPAVQGPDGVLTFGALAAAARGVARTLLEDGPGGTVVVRGGASPQYLAAALGVMAAGAAVVPVGPDDPQARVAVILRDSGARAVLDLATLRLDPHDARLPAVDGGELAYVLFTSGSTGRPKGVMIEHRNVLAYVRYVADAYRVDGTVPALPALTPPSFDASVLQTYAPLTRGEPVWLLPHGTREDPAALVAALRERPGSGLHCVPSLWEEALREVEDGAALPLRALLLGGEVVRPELWERTRRALPATRLANVYGPTEATVQATGGFQAAGEPLTTGRAITGTTVTVRDEHGAVLPPGVRGEVHIAGAGVGRGYLGRDELTAGRFRVEDGVRVFRTGDAGTLGADGTLVVHGRLDDQVKVRGYRIEPGDVEAALLRHPAVTAAAVAVQHPGSSSARLVAAVVARPGAGDLRAFVAGELPSYLVPALVRAVPRLPHAASGKVDRDAVAALFDAAAPDASPGTRPAPGDEIAAKVAAIWAELLGAAPDGPGDDFFDQGGHSLLATRFVARLRKAFGRPIPLRTVFDLRTFGAVTAAVRELAGTGAAAPSPARPDTAATTAARPDTAATTSTPPGTAATTAAPPAPLVEPVAVPADRPVPLSLQQRSLWHAEQVAPGMATAHVVLPLRLTGAVDEPRIAGALRALAGRHEALRTVVDPGRGDHDGAGATLRVRPEAVVPLRVHDLRDADEAGRHRRGRSLAWQAYRTPFDLTAEPPVRAVWLRLADAESVLLLVLHHIACDGASLRILVADLTRSLHRTDAGPDAGTESRPRATYRDFSAWQAARLAAGELDAQRAFWAARLAAPRDAVRWPLPEPRLRTYRQAITACDAPAALTGALEALATAHRTSPLVVVCAALGVLLRRRYGTGEPATGILTANRTHAEFDGTVGLFATTLVLRTPVAADAPFTEVLGAVREAALQAVAHQEVPLDVVLETTAAADPPMDVALVMDIDEVPASTSDGPGDATGDTAGDTVGVQVVVPEADDVPTGVALAPTPLTVFVARHGAGLRLAAEYSTDVFEEKEALALLEALLGILADATAGHR
ncbi:AMP-binding protein [Dactylosporangium sp. CA-052675]|uniref:AMP-binding protein n=1 Tax=Dactylosporangium sp. CA-052675 TaxID=3239927 RepID=UPI003D8A3E54